MTHWSQEVESEQWETWRRAGISTSQRYPDRSGLGHEDLVSQVMEKLIALESKPESIEAGIRKAVRNLFIDRLRVVERNGIQTHDFQDSSQFDPELKGTWLSSNLCPR